MAILQNPYPPPEAVAFHGFCPAGSGLLVILTGLRPSAPPFIPHHRWGLFGKGVNGNPSKSVSTTRGGGFSRILPCGIRIACYPYRATPCGAFGATIHPPPQVGAFWQRSKSDLMAGSLTIFQYRLRQFGEIMMFPRQRFQT